MKEALRSMLGMCCAFCASDMMEMKLHLEAPAVQLGGATREQVHPLGEAVDPVDDPAQVLILDGVDHRPALESRSSALARISSAGGALGALVVGDHRQRVSEEPSRMAAELLDLLEDLRPPPVVGT